MMRREEHYVGRRTMGMQVQGRRKRGVPRRRWLARVKGDIKRRQGPSGRECPTELHGGVYRRTSTQHKSGTKRKEEYNCY